MARSRSKHASTKPSEAEKGGGQFGFPPGSVVTITEGAWVEAQEAGEKFVSSGEPEDPCLKLVGEIEGEDEARPPVYLRAGKAKRGLVPSEDGEFLDIVEGSTATAISEGCNADVFLKSIGKTKAKIGNTTLGGHKNGVPEELHDDGISAVVVGLKFVAGAVVIKREGLENVRPTLVAEEIIELPKAARKGKKRGEDEDEDEPKPRRKAKPADDEDEDEDEPTPKRKKKPAASDDDDDSEKLAETTVSELLESPKYKKGIPIDKVWSAVHAVVRDEEAAVKKAVLKLIEDDDWLKGDRPWKVTGKGEDAVIESA